MTTIATVVLPFNRSTDNTHQFQLPKEQREGVAIPTLYVHKSVFDGPTPPDNIKVTVEEA